MKCLRLDVHCKLFSSTVRPYVFMLLAHRLAGSHKWRLKSIAASSCFHLNNYKPVRIFSAGDTTLIAFLLITSFRVYFLVSGLQFLSAG